MHRTPISRVGKSGTLGLVIIPPIFGGHPLGAWGNRAIDGVVKKEGMNEILFADRERPTLLGRGNECTVHVYGKEEAGSALSGPRASGIPREEPCSDEQLL